MNGQYDSQEAFMMKLQTLAQKMMYPNGIPGQGGSGEMKPEMSPELMAAMQRMEQFHKLAEGILEKVDDANFDGNEVMQYINELGSALEGTGLTQADMEEFIRKEGPFYSKKGFLMAIQ
jgi:hypothetical protein